MASGIFYSLSPEIRSLSARLCKEKRKALAARCYDRVHGKRSHPPPTDPRASIRAMTYTDEAPLVRRLVAETRLDAAARQAIVERGAGLVSDVCERASPSVMEAFLAEYGLSTDEGVGLMCLAEALLRVPDAETIDALIADKIEPSNWGAHLGHSTSSLVNAATWGLMITGRVLDDDPSAPRSAPPPMPTRPHLCPHSPRPPA
jgi:hypothetical protein